MHLLTSDQSNGKFLEHEQEFPADYVVILARVDTLVSIFLCHVVIWFSFMSNN